MISDKSPHLCHFPVSHPPALALFFPKFLSPPGHTRCTFSGVNPCSGTPAGDPSARLLQPFPLLPGFQEFLLPSFLPSHQQREAERCVKASALSQPGSFSNPANTRRCQGPPGLSGCIFTAASSAGGRRMPFHSLPLSGDYVATPEVPKLRT